MSVVKLSGNYDSERTLHVSLYLEDGYLLLVEKEKYVPYGYSRAKWTDNQVRINLDEMRKLVAICEEREAKKK